MTGFTQKTEGGEVASRDRQTGKEWREIWGAKRECPAQAVRGTMAVSGIITAKQTSL